MNNHLLEKYNISVPRYTSYPVILNWNEQASFKTWIKSVKETTDRAEAVDLYIHVPFCEKLCWYCGCNRVISKDTSKAIEYVHYLLKEWQLYQNQIDHIEINSIHFGGGTPNFLPDYVIEDLIQKITKNNQHPAQLSIEMDPRTLNQGFLEFLSRSNLSHISFGIQDFDKDVQQAINRIQPFELVAEHVEYIKAKTNTLINFDLIYGLPKQTEHTIRETIAKVNQLRPEHIALYSYAHLPSVMPNQKLIKDSDLPKDFEKRNLYEVGKQELLKLGYIEIGLDHFALENSSLATAFHNNQLKRSFMGYTAAKTNTTIGLGVSAVSENDDFYLQNSKTISEYYQLLDDNKDLSIRGHKLTKRDKTEKKLINNIMCNQLIDAEDLSLLEKSEYGAALSELVADALIVKVDRDYKVTNTGKPFLRNIAAIFDSYFTKRNNRYSTSL